ncbi:MAG: hypothetical protein ACI9C1_002018 [Candidatus Aldehydirespiratoraceae bacterium]|jgi:hypothetical protein
MQINCWHETGAVPARDSVSIPKMPDDRVTELREAITTTRGGKGVGVLFSLHRRFSDVQRALARLAMGVGVVVASFAAVAAFVAPGSAGMIMVGIFLPAVLIGGGAAVLGYRRDVGIEVFADGTLRRVGWGGITEVDLARYARVSVDG